MLLTWYAWRARNDAKHNGKKITSQGIIALTMKQLHLIHVSFRIPASFWKGDASLAQHLGLHYTRVTLKPLIFVYWKRPPDSWTKLNTNASVHPQFLSAAAAGILRCSNGRVIRAYQKILGPRNAFEAELEAIYIGLKLCRQLGYTKVIVEADAQSVIHVLNSGRTSIHWKSMVIFKQIQLWKTDMEIIFSHIHREGNAVADSLESDALKFNVSKELCFGECNNVIKKLVFSDNTGIPYLRIPK